MKNNENKLVKVFAESLGLNKEVITDNLQYNSIPEWDSVAHMSLISEIEEAFDIMLDTDDIIEMNSPAKAREILAKYNVEF
jgi:acyl carrier protein